MNNSLTTSGHCLCGAVTISATVSNQLGACHCKMCQRWSGSALLSVEVLDNLNITGEENITVYDSSEWADRAFCKCCGSHLFFRSKKSQTYYIPIGLLDDVTGIQFQSQIYIEKKPDYYTFADKTETMTEAEVIAFYATKA